MLKITSFRGRLALWFASLASLTLLIVGVYVGQLATRQMAITAGESIHTTALGAAHLLEANLRERELEITLLSMAPLFIRGDFSDPDVLQSLENRRRVHTEYAWLGVADVNGTVVQAVDGMLRGQSVAKRPWFVAGLKEPYLGDVNEALLLAKLLPGLASGEPRRFVDFAVPIRNRAGTVIGVLGAHGHWSWVTDTVKAVTERLDASSGTQILVVDAKGDVLYPEGLMDRTHLPTSLATDRPYAKVKWDDGEEYLTSAVTVDSHPTSKLGWKIVVRQPLDAALEPIYAMRLRLLGLGLGAVVVFVFVAFRLARAVSRPIEQLAQAARQVERREGVPQFPEVSNVQEIAQLSQSMQAMTQSLLQREEELKTINQTLEQQVCQRTVSLETANRQLEQLATRDALTGLHNRRSFDAKIADYVQIGKRSGRGFAILMVDADHFKRINDTHGHSVGDAVLQQLAQLLTEHVRVTDFVARYGGKEFVVLLPDSVQEQNAKTVAEEIRLSAEQSVFPTVGSVTVSIGISHWSLSDTDLQAVFKRADQALYCAKAAGRNKVVVSGVSV